MFSKKQRIDREKIGKIMKNPDFLFNNTLLTIKKTKNNLGYNRYSTIVPKKTEKSAVKRHFIKRKIVNWVKESPLCIGFDLIFYIKNKDIIKNKKEFDSLVKKCIID